MREKWKKKRSRRLRRKRRKMRARSSTCSFPHLAISNSNHSYLPLLQSNRTLTRISQRNPLLVQPNCIAVPQANDITRAARSTRSNATWHLQSALAVLYPRPPPFGLCVGIMG
ncbi:hypothetical protein BDV98DRAFT_346704 [Pterulicium gracile]|uniref:60S ribosomal protein L41 n=1 Tax=Pterulicium gracile TaxID=1884261 RepID=A0A5C3QP55_9AGAR|nr:hypothetical protein BDV98DRAFT_346704 [Pterula gracilis]